MVEDITCISGMPGWRTNLQNNYTDFDDFVRYAEQYELHARLGYQTAIEAWMDNPLVEGSVIPSDFRKS